MKRRSTEEQASIDIMAGEGFCVCDEFPELRKVYMVKEGGHYITINKAGNVRAGKH
jgi:hypothetical protein